MSTILTPNLKLQNILTGTQQTTWWNTENVDRTLEDQAMASVAEYTITGDTALTIGTTVPSPTARVWILGGSLASPATITFAPNTAQSWNFVVNNTNQTLTFTQGLGVSLSMVAGQSATLLFDGLGAGAGVGQFSFKIPVGPGTVLAPAYSFVGMTDVGLYVPAIHSLGIADNGATMVSFTATSIPSTNGLNLWGNTGL